MHQFTIKKILLYYYAILLAGLGLTGHVLWTETHRAPLQIHVLDIGQGDAILIETPARQNILIDGGPDATVLSRLGEELPWYRQAIDLVVLTHPDADHVTGLIPVLRRHDVRAVMLTGVEHPGSAYKEFLEAVAQERARVVVAGEVRQIDLGSGARLIVLFPLESLARQAPKKQNDAGIVLKLSYGKNDALFTADVEKAVERMLVENPALVESEVLKVGHHGSKTSTSPDFLAAVRPTYALISAGARNRYGHPAPEVTSRLTVAGVTWRSTSVSGTLHVLGDGMMVWLDELP